MVQYFINPKRKQIVCVLNDKHTGRSFKGVAKCAPEDEFNAEFGKRLAFLRAQSKEITASIGVMAGTFDTETQQMFLHQNAALKVREKAIRVMERGQRIAVEIENMLK